MRKILALLIAMNLLIFGLIAYEVHNGTKPGIEDEALAVKSWKGEHIGFTHHALMDSSTGNIVFLVLSLGKGKKEIVVPISAFSSYNHKNRTLVLGVSRQTLIAAPEFHLSDLRDPTFAERVYRFFGEAPAWTDGAKARERRI